MDDTLILLFIFGLGLPSCSPAPPVIRQYHYVSEPMNWTNAQKYCRLYYSDLATFESMDDISRLNRPSSVTSWAWFGLTDGPKSWKGIMGNDSNSWRWSTTGETSRTGYQNWAVNQPNQYSTHQSCVAAESNGKWNDVSCAAKYFFVCYKDTVPPGLKTYKLIQYSRTWKEAQAYCRRYYTDLALIEDVTEFLKMKSVMLPRRAWIGLYRVLWRWSDRSNSTFRNWQRRQPNNLWQYCAAENSPHQWNDIQCYDELSFVCQGDLKVRKSLLRMKIQSAANLSDANASNQTLQQLQSELRNRTARLDVNLVWHTQPREEEEDDDDEEEADELDVICNKRRRINTYNRN